MCKRLFCVLFLLVLLCSPLNTFAENEASFKLSDVSTDKNRLFETKLSVSCDVAAFVLSLTFDEKALEFREAKALSEDARLSVNSSEAGKVKISYLCESESKGDIVTFTFKSSEQSTSIDLNAEQVIDSDANDISLSGFKGAEVTVNRALAQDKNNNKPQGSKPQAETSESMPESSAKSSETYIEIPPEKDNNKTLIICIIGGTALIFAVAAVAFILGKKASAENK